MVTTLVGDLFESRMQTLVNTVNCVGVMGKGIALEFKRRFPDMFAEYAALCKVGRVQLGKPYLHRRLTPPWVLNFPTKDHWRSVAKLEDIVRGLDWLERHYEAWGITSLAVPPLGCGEGQLEWRVVGPTLYRGLKRFAIPVELYAPFGTPTGQLDLGFLDRSDPVGVVRETAPRLDPGAVALAEILNRITSEPYHHPIGRITFAKIAYFATCSGIPTGLAFERREYGPYARSLKRLQTQLVNNGLLVEVRSGPMFQLMVGPTFNDALRYYDQFISRWHDLIDRLVDLFLRMNSHRAEVAATVAFSAHDLSTRLGRSVSESEVFEDVMSWKSGRTPPIDPVEVALSIRNLAMLGWLRVTPDGGLPLPESMSEI